MAKKKRTATFLLCIRNDGYPASLEVRKIYQSLPDPKAAADAIIEIASVDVQRDGTITDKTETLVRADIPVPPEASAIHHLIEEDLVTAPWLEEAIGVPIVASRAISVRATIRFFSLPPSRISLGLTLSTSPTSMRSKTTGLTSRRSPDLPRLASISGSTPG